MQGGSVAVAVDGEIRFLRAHALAATCRYVLFGVLFFFGLVVCRQGEVGG